MAQSPGAGGTWGGGSNAFWHGGASTEQGTCKWGRLDEAGHALTLEQIQRRSADRRRSGGRRRS